MNQLLSLLVTLQIPSDTGAVLYQAWCKNCHGVDGRGTPSAMTRLNRSPPDLADCRVSSAEPENLWVGIVSSGGAAYGLSIDMPAFGDGASPEQIRAVVRYVRSLCREPGWPPGELNFPRAFLVEKAFPESELVLSTEGRGQKYIFEHRVGKRGQVELNLQSRFDSAGRPFAGAGAAIKYNIWHSLKHRALVSLGLEGAPPVGRQAEWEAEPFVTFGIEPVTELFVQGEIAASLDRDGLTGWSYRLGLGHGVGRVVPMLEAGWDIPTGSGGGGGTNRVTFYPQLWIQLSRLGHVAGSVGAALPAAGAGTKDARLTASILWDFGDAPLLRGW